MSLFLFFCFLFFVFCFLFSFCLFGFLCLVFVFLCLCLVFVFLNFYGWFIFCVHCIVNDEKWIIQDAVGGQDDEEV